MPLLTTSSVGQGTATAVQPIAKKYGLPNMRSSGYATTLIQPISLTYVRHDQILITPTTRSSLNSYTIRRNALTSSLALRFFLRLESGTFFPPNSGYVFCDVGSDQIAQRSSIELALVNTSSKRALPSLQVRIFNGISTTILQEIPNVYAGLNHYLELFVRRSPTPRVQLYWASPEVPTLDTVPAGMYGSNLNTIRFGVLSAIGPGDLPSYDASVAGIAGLDNPADNTRIGPAEVIQDLTQYQSTSTDEIITSALTGDTLWYQTDRPQAFWGRNLLNPDYSTFVTAPLPLTIASLPHIAPASTQNTVVFVAGIADDPGAGAGSLVPVFYFIDSVTGAPEGTLTLPTDPLSKLISPVPLNDRIIYLKADGLTFMAIDPTTRSVLWRKTVTGAAQILSILPWPLADASLLITYKASDGMYNYLWTDADLNTLFTAESSHWSSRPFAITHDGTIYSGSEYNYGWTVSLQRFTYKTPATFTLASESPLPANSYLIHPGAVPSLNNARPSVALSRSSVLAVTASPAYATNPNPTSLTLRSWSTDLATVNWNVILCQSLSGRVDQGCSLGSVQTDDSGYAYVTYSYPDAYGSTKWYMRAFEPVNGAPVTPEIQVTGPGFPQASSVQASILRYLHVVLDYEKFIRSWLPSGYWRFNDAVGSTTLLDSSGSGFNGTSTALTSVAGLLKFDTNRAASFNGTSSYVTIPDNAALRPDTSSFSWTLVFSTTSTARGVLFRKSNLNNANGITIEVNTPSAGNIRITLHTGSTFTLNAFPANNGQPHALTIILDQDKTPGSTYVRVVLDGQLYDFGVNAPLAGVSFSATAAATFGWGGALADAFAGGFFNGIIEEAAVFPGRVYQSEALSLTTEQFRRDFGTTQWSIIRDGPDARERWLQAFGVGVTSSDATVEAADYFELPASGASIDPYDRTPLPLIPALIEPGGTLELLHEVAGEMIRLAFVTDLTSGLNITRSITNLDRIEFEIPLDRFSPNSPEGISANLRDLQQKWQKDHSLPAENVAPYDKPSLLRDHVYLRYTERDGKERTFRVVNLDESATLLKGSGIDYSIKLSDYLTQYVAGRSQYVGHPPSEIISHILDADQSIRITNRRFSTDRPIRMAISSDIPDMSPSTDTSTNYRKSPEPYVKELEAINPTEAALFSGLPHETVGPRGTTDARVPGSVGFHSFADDATHNGFFLTQVFSGAVQAPVNWTTSSPLVSGESAAHMSRVIYGCIKSTVSGRYGFQLSTTAGHRVYFRGEKISDNFATSGSFVTNWFSDLEDNTWYPFVFHQTNSAAPRVIQFNWLIPDTSWVTVPASNLTSQMHGGLFPVRFVDADGAIRYFQCYKRWDGKAIVLAVPTKSTFPTYVDASLPTARGGSAVVANGGTIAHGVPNGTPTRVSVTATATKHIATVTSVNNTNLTIGLTDFDGTFVNTPEKLYWHADLPEGDLYDWPKSVPAGTMIEEVVFPSDHPLSTVHHWGSGWTRRPGPSFLNIPSTPVATFQSKATNY